MAAPVGLARLVIQIASGLTIGVIVAVGLAYAPGLVADGAVVVAAGAPPEEVAVCVLAVAVLARGGAKDIPLVMREFPVRRGGAADVLQVALREIHLAATAVDGEPAVDGARGCIVLNGADQTHTAAVVTVVAALRIHVRIEEVHVVGVVAAVVGGRPVVALGTSIIDRGPLAPAGSRQEDRAILLQRFPLLGGYRVAAVAGTDAVRVVQRVI